MLVVSILCRHDESVEPMLTVRVAVFPSLAEAIEKDDEQRAIRWSYIILSKIEDATRSLELD